MTSKLNVIALLSVLLPFSAYAEHPGDLINRIEKRNVRMQCPPATCESYPPMCATGLESKYGTLQLDVRLNLGDTWKNKGDDFIIIGYFGNDNHREYFRQDGPKLPINLPEGTTKQITINVLDIHEAIRRFKINQGEITQGKLHLGLMETQGHIGDAIVSIFTDELEMVGPWRSFAIEDNDLMSSLDNFLNVDHRLGETETVAVPKQFKTKTFVDIVGYRYQPMADSHTDCKEVKSKELPHSRSGIK